MIQKKNFAMNSLFFNDQTASFIILNALLQIILPDMVTEI